MNIPPFQLRIRGDDTKLIFAETSGDHDEILVKGIAKAHDWHRQIKSGKPLSDIATVSSISNQRVQKMIELTLLTPYFSKDGRDDQWPSWFSSNWFERQE